MEMPNRNLTSENYRYGYNGEEKDDEMYNESGAALDFGDRIYSSRLGKWLSLDPLSNVYTSISDYTFAGDSPISVKDNGGAILEDANGNIIVTSTGQIGKRQAVATTERNYRKDGSYTQDFIINRYERVYIYTDEGTPVEALKLVQSYEETSEFDKDGNHIKVLDKRGVDSQKHDGKADCHGYTFTNNELWINNDQVDTILDEDGYEETSESDADIAIFRNNNGQVYHSAVRNPDGKYNNNAGILNTEYDQSLEESERDLMNQTSNGKEKFDRNKNVDFRKKTQSNKNVNDFIGPLPNGVKRQ